VTETEQFLAFLREKRNGYTSAQPDLLRYLKGLDHEGLVVHCTAVLEAHGARPIWEPPLRASWHRRSAA
jgi:hypothetical protein